MPRRPTPLPARLGGPPRPSALRLPHASVPNTNGAAGASHASPLASDFQRVALRSPLRSSPLPRLHGFPPRLLDQRASRSPRHETRSSCPEFTAVHGADVSEAPRCLARERPGHPKPAETLQEGAAQRSILSSMCSGRLPKGPRSVHFPGSPLPTPPDSLARHSRLTPSRGPTSLNERVVPSDSL